VDKTTRSTLLAISALGMVGGWASPMPLNEAVMAPRQEPGYCQCGKRISANKQQCKACKEAESE
jgi:hypothetical protein